MLCGTGRIGQTAQTFEGWKYNFSLAFIEKNQPQSTRKMFSKTTLLEVYQDSAKSLQETLENIL
jgi:hypothetical protein